MKGTMLYGAAAILTLSAIATSAASATTASAPEAQAKLFEIQNATIRSQSTTAYQGLISFLQSFDHDALLRKRALEMFEILLRSNTKLDLRSSIPTSGTSSDNGQPLVIAFYSDRNGDIENRSVAVFELPTNATPFMQVDLKRESFRSPSLTKLSIGTSGVWDGRGAFQDGAYSVRTRTSLKENAEEQKFDLIVSGLDRVQPLPAVVVRWTSTDRFEIIPDEWPSKDDRSLGGNHTLELTLVNHRRESPVWTQQLRSSQRIVVKAPRSEASDLTLYVSFRRSYVITPIKVLIDRRRLIPMSDLK